MTKTNTRSRIVSILLVLVMLLTMVPITGVTANAADTSWTTVNTYDQLKAALSNQNPPDNTFFVFPHKKSPQWFHIPLWFHQGAILFCFLP